MVKIIQAFRNPNPIADALKNFGSQLRASQPTALERQRLEDARQKALALDQLANSFGGDIGEALRAGISGSDFGRFNLSRAAAAAGEGEGDLLGDRGLNAAQLGAGLSASSTGLGFREGEANQTARSKYSTDVSAATSRANTAASIAAAQEQALAKLAEERRQFDTNFGLSQRKFDEDLIEGVDLVSGRPQYRPRNRVDFRFAPLTSTDERSAIELDRLLAEGGTALEDASPIRRSLFGATPSESEVKGDVLLNLAQGNTVPGLGPVTAPSLQGAFGLEEPKPVEVQRYQTPDGRAFRSVDGGRSDMDTEEQIPANAVPVGKMQANSRTDAGLSPTASVATDTFRANAALRDLNDTIGVMRGLAESNPQAFGAGGFIRRVAQGAESAARSIGDVFGAEGEAQFTRAVNALGPEAAALAPGIYDPSLDAVNRVHQLILFQSASALAGQEGRAVTDADIRRMEIIVPPPQELFGSAEKMNAALDDLAAIIGLRSRANTERMGGRFNIGAGGGAVPEGVDPAVWRALTPEEQAAFIAAGQ